MSIRWCLANQRESIITVHEGVDMHEKRAEPKALFLFSNGLLIADDLICSGELETQFTGPCKYSRDGKMPGLVRLVFDENYHGSRLGMNGDFVPRCALEQLGSLANWQLIIGEKYPHRYWHFRVFKCRQMLMLIVPGIRNDQASVFQDD
jgi:hypothetical protein